VRTSNSTNYCNGNGETMKISWSSWCVWNTRNYIVPQLSCGKRRALYVFIRILQILLFTTL
jgi:hypothetical protein